MKIGVNKINQVALIILGLTAIITLWCLTVMYRDYVDGGFLLNVKVAPAIARVRDFSKGGVVFSYDYNGSIYYRPLSFFETVKYHYLLGYLFNCVIIVILSICLFSFSQKRDLILFSANTLHKFYALLFIFLALFLVKLFIFYIVRSEFFEKTGHSFQIIEYGGGNYLAIGIGLMFLIVVVHRLIDAGMQIEKRRN